MAFDLLTSEQEALQSLIDLIAQAKKCQQLHERANLTLPEPLKRFLGISTNGHKKPLTIIPAPERASVPREAQQGWISIEAKSAYPTTIVLALLRNGSLVAKEMVNRVQAILPEVSRGTVNNIGTRLDGNAIARSKEGWNLLSPDTAPVLHEGYVWGPPEIFSVQELAVHRREALLHLLQLFRAGLQTSQIIEQLQNCPWVHAPVSKELVQDDVELLSKQEKIKRRGNSKKWEIVRRKAEETET